jgi:hypothetical protein
MSTGWTIRRSVACCTTHNSLSRENLALETNKAMNRAMEGMGGKVVTTYRLYEKAL